GPSQDFMRF
uniref:FMRFamide-13 n=1 Tax=Lucilia cuprina TaxID=7375 RepID=FAR13_LUCCU|nr:RecName: Full=FMRFamide-13; AltName: Full=LucFMRFamide-13 [Lucilia cuprina]